jgi:hypothetical protein
MTEPSDKAAAESPAPNNVTSAMADRLDKVELLIEQMGRNTHYVQTFNDYVSGLKSELRILRWIRILAVLLATVFIFTAFGTLLCILFYHKGWFWTLGTYDRAALIVGSLAACVVILSILLKGAFKALSDAEHGEIVPEHLKLALQVARDAQPKA